MAIPSIAPKLPTIPSDDFTKERELGQGGFGKVYFGKWQITTPVAVKELLVQSMTNDFLKIFRSEAELMAGCQHPNIVRLFGLCLEEGKFALIMEYLEEGSLYGILKNKDISLEWTRRFTIAAGIGKGLLYLHSQKVIHCDLKSHNILLAKDIAKISDFGLAKIRSETSTQMTTNQLAGSPCWMAPEHFTQNAPASFATDIYSFGMILWEIAARRAPYSHAINVYMVIAAKMNNTHETIPSDCPEEYGALIQKCWKLPLERPLAKTIALELNQLQERAKHQNLDHPIAASVSPAQPNKALELPSESRISYLSNAMALATKSLPPARLNKAEPAQPNKPMELPTESVLSYPSNTTTFADRPIESIPKTPANKAVLPSIAFGKAEWAKYFGDVGVEPPLPGAINAILAAPCPFWPRKKVQETHLLVLVPQMVNGEPLTLKTLGKLILKPRQGRPTQYRDLRYERYNLLRYHNLIPDNWHLQRRDPNPFDFGEYTDAPAARSHWALLTRDVIEGSLNKNYSDQKALINEHEVPVVKLRYEVPTILDATVAILMEHVRGNELNSDFCARRYTRCQERFNKNEQLAVGWCGSAGLSIDNFHSGYVHAGYDFVNCGVGGLRKFF